MTKKNKKSIFFKVFFALVVGFINGFFGGGGGLVCVPTLKSVYKLKTKNAHATAIAIMFPLSVVSSVLYIIKGGINVLTLSAITGGVILGGFIGAVSLKKLNSKAVKWIFIAILFIAGVRMVV